MKTLMLLLFAVVLPCLAAAYDNYYPPIVVDGSIDDWYWAWNGCSGDNIRDVYPASDDKYSVEMIYCCCGIDRLYGKFYGAWELMQANFFSDSILTCYEMFFDKESLGVTVNPGDTSLPISDYAHERRYPPFNPDHRFRFCGKNGIVEEERYQYWDGQQWVGNGMADDPRMNYAFKLRLQTGQNKVYSFEFEFDGLDEMNYPYQFPGRQQWLKHHNIWSIFTQSEYYDYGIARTDVAQTFYEGINGATWLGVKTQ
jgi:hypothetical protein